jgi:hypothetical protein
LREAGAGKEGEAAISNGDMAMQPDAARGLFDPLGRGTLMQTISASVQDLTRQLLALETAPGEPSEAHGGEATRVIEKLRTSLTKQIGTAGFSALLSRALVLAKAEAAPSLLRRRRF